MLDLGLNGKVAIITGGSDGLGRAKGDLEAHHAELAKQRVPLGRVAHASEVADLFAFLVSERASYITGASVNFDGVSGMTVYAGGISITGPTPSPYPLPQWGRGIQNDFLSKRGGSCFPSLSPIGGEGRSSS